MCPPALRKLRIYEFDVPNDAWRTPPERHRLADGQLSSPYPPSPSFSSFGAASVMLCCSAHLVCSSTPLRPSVNYPSISLVVNIMYIQTFCEHLNVLNNFDQTDLNRVEVRLELNGTNARRSLILLPCLRLTPRRHRQDDGQLSPLYPPSPSFSSFGAACVKLCCLPPPSLVRNIRLCCLV